MAWICLTIGQFWRSRAPFSNCSQSSLNIYGTALISINRKSLQTHRSSLWLFAINVYGVHHALSVIGQQQYKCCFGCNEKHLLHIIQVTPLHIQMVYSTLFVSGTITFFSSRISESRSSRFFSNKGSSCCVTWLKTEQNPHVVLPSMHIA